MLNGEAIISWRVAQVPTISNRLSLNVAGEDFTNWLALTSTSASESDRIGLRQDRRNGVGVTQASACGAASVSVSTASRGMTPIC